MKRRWYLILLTIFVLGTSCKQKREEIHSNTPNSEESKRDYNFYVSVFIKSSVSETIRLYYIGLDDSSYSEDRSLKLALTPSDTFQELKFTMEEIPEKFRIDLGDSANEGLMEIDKVILANEGKTISVGWEVLERYFKPNIYMKVNIASINRIKVDGRYDPFMESRDLLHQQILIDFIQ